MFERFRSWNATIHPSCVVYRRNQNILLVRNGGVDHRGWTIFVELMREFNRFSRLVQAGIAKASNWKSTSEGIEIGRLKDHLRESPCLFRTERTEHVLILCIDCHLLLQSVVHQLMEHRMRSDLLIERKSTSVHYLLCQKSF
jgi:hypothetical protein